MYEDYAINETLFHWQSQNEAGPHTTKGIGYINQRELNKKILLFVRESPKDSLGNTTGYVFVGLGNFVTITWKLEEPIPEYLWTASAKMAVG